MSNNDKIREAFKNIIETCMGTKAGEEVLIITDPPRLDIAESMRSEIIKLHANAEIILLPDPDKRKNQPLSTPSNILMGAISRADIILNFFENIPLEMRPFRSSLIEEARKTGRVGHMIGTTSDSFKKGGLFADYQEIGKYSDILAEILSKGKNITIKSGPNFECELKFKNFGGWYELATSESGILTEKGSFGNLPAGEAFIAISSHLSEDINGKICVDHYIHEVGSIDYTKPVILTVVNGEVTEIEPEGNITAEKLKEILKEAEKEADNQKLEPQYVYRVAEIGIGTNPEAIIGASVIETEKRRGTMHIALGENITMGGNYKAPIHIDCVLSKIKLEIDDKPIIEGGKLNILKTLYRQFEEHYDHSDKTLIDGGSLITKVSSDVSIDGEKLYKIWKDRAGRSHKTKVGDSMMSQNAAQLWQLIEHHETVKKLLTKTDFSPEMVYQLLRLLRQYLLVSIQEKNITDYLTQLQDQTENNYIDLKKSLQDFSDSVKEASDQEKIYLTEIMRNITLLNDDLNNKNLDGMLERIKRIESNTNELINSDSEILSSKLTLSAGLLSFLSVSGEIDLKKLLTKIREKLDDIKKRLSS